MHAKTRDVLQKLRGIAGEGCVTQEVIAAAPTARLCVFAASCLMPAAGLGCHYPQRRPAALPVLLGSSRRSDMIGGVE